MLTSYAKFHGINVEQGDSVHIVIDLDEKTPEQISEIEGQFIKNGFELIFPTVPSNTGCYFISRIIQKHLCRKNWKKSIPNKSGANTTNQRVFGNTLRPGRFKMLSEGRKNVS